MNISRYDIEQLISKYFQELRSSHPPANMSIPIPMKPLDITIDVEPIATAIHEGLSAIASAVEYKAQLEDARERDFNKVDANTYADGASTSDLPSVSMGR